MDSIFWFGLDGGLIERCEVLDFCRNVVHDCVCDAQYSCVFRPVLLLYTSLWIMRCAYGLLPPGYWPINNNRNINTSNNYHIHLRTAAHPAPPSTPPPSQCLIL